MGFAPVESYAFYYIHPLFVRVAFSGFLLYSEFHIDGVSFTKAEQLFTYNKY